MRGVGGPLLCISDLLNDVAEETSGVPHDHAPPSDDSKLPPSDIPKLFQLCSALEIANKLVDSSNSSVTSLSEKGR
ncbi:hypothetical protein ACP275_07G091200 [Erythranthe tilingii]